jgi:hypothetical protein
MMAERDHEDIILIAIMDMMFQHLRHKNRKDKKRVYRLERAHNALMSAEKGYIGSIPDWLGDKAEELNEQIDTALKGMKQ